MVELRNSHLLLDSDLVSEVFPDSEYAYASYQPETSTLLLSSVSNEWFKQLYKNTAQYLLKTRNLKGDRSLAITDILIDHDVDTGDRPLDYEWEKNSDLIKITL